MEDVDFIKWKCSKTTDCFYNEGMLICSTDQYRIAVKHNKGVITPLHELLLQKAIEGVNNKVVKDSSDITIKQFAYDIVVDCSSIGGRLVRYPFLDFKWTIYKAKEEALKYVYKQEIK